MHTTRTDCLKREEESRPKYQSSKKAQHNRIQIVSKLNKNQSNIHSSLQTFTSQEIANEIKPLRRTYNIPENNNEQSQQISRQIKEYMEYMRGQFQQRIKKQSLQHSMYQIYLRFSEINRLKIKLESNNQLIANKQAVIEELNKKIKVMNVKGSGFFSSPTSSASKGSTLQFNRNSKTKKTLQDENVNDLCHKKIDDLETKLKIIIKAENQLSSLTQSIFQKVQTVQNCLLNHFANKLTTLQNKLNSYLNNNQQKLTILLQNCQHLSSDFNKKKQTSQKMQQNLTKNLTKLNSIKQNIQLTSQQFSSQLSNSFTHFKKQFEQINHKISNINDNFIVYVQRYRNKKTVRKNSNNNLINISNISEFSNNGANDQQNSINILNTPSKNYNNKKQCSCFFEDYQQQIYEELDSLYEDKFFHPMNTSNIKTQRTPMKSNIDNRPIFLASNKSKEEASPSFFKQPKKIIFPQQQSYQNFTSIQSQQQQQTINTTTTKDKSGLTPNRHQSNIKSNKKQSPSLAHQQSSNKISSVISQNQIRFIKTIKQLHQEHNFPIALEIDINGMAKIKGEIRYLIDSNEKYFRFSEEELNRLLKYQYIKL